MLKPKKKQLPLVLFALIASTLDAETNSPTSQCHTLLPRIVSDWIYKSYPNWKIATLDNLDPEDRAAWVQRQPTGCPGIVAGDFKGTKSIQFLILLHSKDEPANSLVLLANIVKPDQVELDRVTLWSRSYSLAVSRLPAGKYSDYYLRDKIINVTYDVMVVGLPSGRATAFYYQNNQLRTFSLVD